VSETLVSGGYLDMRPSIDEFFADTDATWPEGLAGLTEPADALTFSDVMADGKTSLLPGDVDFFNSNADIPNPAYDAAIAAQDAGKLAMDQFFIDNDLDALAMPTSATAATPDWAGTTFCDVGANTGVPTVSLPAGFTSTGTAAGLELAAPRSQDAALLAMSYDYEQATLNRVAPASTPELAAAPTPEPTASPTAPPVEPTAEPTATAGPVAPAPTPKPTAKPGAALAHTGAEGTTGLAALAFALIAGGAGALALTATRRRTVQK
jgi:amidase